MIHGFYSQRFRRFLAVVMAVVFVQGLLGTNLHFQTEEHYFCVEHQQLTHDRSHAEQSRADAGELSVEAPDHHEAPSQDDKRPSAPDNCFWMTWLQKSGQASPDLTPELLDLPPPGQQAEADTPRTHQFDGHVVDLARVSPANSPPRLA